MLEPKKVKFRKTHRGNRRGMSMRGDYVSFGNYGLKAGKMWIRIFPDKPVTARPAETRMGKGKGSLDHWVSVVKPGRIMFEIDGVTREEAELAFKNAGHKLPIKTKIVERRSF